VVDADQHGRLVEAARAGGPPAADDDLGTAFDRVIDVRLDQLDLRREDDRPDVDRARRAGRALAERLDLCPQAIDELLVDRVLDVDPLDRDADLAGVDIP
jgi:hypothetical protein